MCKTKTTTPVLLSCALLTPAFCSLLRQQNAHARAKRALSRVLGFPCANGNPSSFFFISVCESRDDNQEKATRKRRRALDCERATPDDFAGGKQKTGGKVKWKKKWCPKKKNQSTERKKTPKGSGVRAKKRRQAGRAKQLLGNGINCGDRFAECMLVGSGGLAATDGTGGGVGGRASSCGSRRRRHFLFCAWVGGGNRGGRFLLLSAISAAFRFFSFSFVYCTTCVLYQNGGARKKRRSE